MDSDITVEALPLLGTCNLCLNMGSVKSMIVAYKINGNKELYTEMLLDCFSIDTSVLQLGDTKRVICEPCVEQLRASLRFRQQVEASFRTLEAMATLDVVKKEEKLAADGVEDELTHDLDDAACDDYDDLDEPDIFSDIIIKKEEANEEPTARRTRKKLMTTTKKKKTKLMKYSSGLPAKKLNDSAEVEKLLNSGLFPFKIRKNNTFSCSVCSEKFPTLDETKTHTLDHTKKMIHIAFRKMVYFNSQRFYKCGDKIRCKICTADLTSYDELKSHIDNCTRLRFTTKSNWNNLPFKLEKDQLDCPVCKKKFINFVSLNTHMNVHYPNYICENCGKAFASKARLRGHIRTHEIGEFPCRYCDAVFDKVTKRENHVSKDHKSGVRYACKRCNIALSSFYARQKHLAEVHNEELKRYKCKACPQSYITPGHLSSHVRRDHLNERNHKCDKCDLAFYTKNALKMHMIKHDGERIHTCPVCQKSYQRKKTLREHLRIHNNDKRFICPVCGRAFTQKCTLKGHLKVHDRKVELDDVVVPLQSI
ncbi:unnamed protein product [Plutella xylostella]|uniref:(diamondback moth) hypothetical protein n=1 Tax=Plutella xylostella TaxID=51655 RepID=A0A8S4DX71_PLUXY|nr:unnamed protein product [Plutella xylostella]